MLLGKVLIIAIWPVALLLMNGLHKDIALLFEIKRLGLIAYFQPLLKQGGCNLLI